MSTYCVTTRIANKSVGGKTYDERRSQLIQNMYEKGKGWWEETTSFYLVESYLDTNSFALKASNGLSKSDDLIVVFDPSDMSAAYFGPLAQTDVLRSFFRVLKNID
jgi:hypothetical protein